MLNLRYYQRDAVDSAWRYLQSNHGNPLIVIPTGGGKSAVLSKIIEEAMQYDQARIIVATHVKELVQQNYEEYIGLSPFAPAGIYSAGLNRRDHHARILFAGIQSIYNKAEKLQRCDLLLIDECHTIAQKDDGRWRTFLGHMQAINRGMRIIGLTATPYRLDSGMLTTGENKIFDDICYEYPLLRAIEDGYLCPIVPTTMATRYDLSNVRTLGGDYKQDELEAAFNIDEKTMRAIDEIEAYGQDRRSWLIFAAGNNHAYAIHEELKKRGYLGAVVTKDTNNTDRDRATAEIKNYKIRYLVNNKVFTTGFNAKNIDLIADFGATKSAGLHVQKLGRGTRTIGANIEQSIANGKSNCISSGSLVLTNYGLIPIEKITKNMKVWDGIDFVNHDGIIFRGVKECIKYAGLIATPDHKVLTKNGWKSFKECADNNIGIRVAEKNGEAIQFSRNIFRSDSRKKRIEEVLCFNKMRFVPKDINEGIYEFNDVKSWLQKMWEKKKQKQASFWCSKMVMGEVQFSEAEVCKQKKSKLQKLWRKGGAIQIWDCESYGEIYNGEPWVKRRITNRQNRQQWPLRARKFKASKTQNKYEQSKDKFWDKKYALIQKGVPAGKICRLYNNKTVKNGSNSSRHRASLFQSKVMQTEREVWDILNCGPRNSFCVNGLIVHNCVLLDFARNVDYHGPLDKIRGRDKSSKGDADAPVKVCPQCNQVCFAGLRTCFKCGYEFPFDEQNKIRTDGGDNAILSTQIEPEWHKVASVAYDLHQKEGKTPSMRVSYFTFNGIYREWICFEHSGFAKKKAQTWHMNRLFREEIPTTIDAALKLKYPNPTKILVLQDGKYPQILDYDFKTSTNEEEVKTYRGMDDDEDYIPF